MTVDVRCSFPADKWDSWVIGSDRNNPDTLRRIVGEWAALESITDRLRVIDSNLEVALGKLLATHELAHKYGLQGAIAPELLAVEPAQVEPAEDDFSLLNDDL